MPGFLCIRNQQTAVPVQLPQEGLGIGITHLCQQFQPLGGLVPVLLFAIVQTSLAEELFFRGFLGKRVIARWGFAPGNAAQAIAFGILHVAMFASFADPIRLLVIGILMGASGWIVGWLNEEGAGGSILPGWALHASANLLVGTAAASNLMG